LKKLLQSLSFYKKFPIPAQKYTRAFINFAALKDF